MQWLKWWWTVYLPSFCICVQALQYIDACVPDRAATETAALSQQSGPTESEGECPYTVLAALKCVPRFIYFCGWGWVGGPVERPLFLSFVYVRRGTRALG